MMEIRGVGGTRRNDRNTSVHRTISSGTFMKNEGLSDPNNSGVSNDTKIWRGKVREGKSNEWMIQ